MAARKAANTCVRRGSATLWALLESFDSHSQLRAVPSPCFVSRAGSAMHKLLVVAAAGGLGSAVVREALSRNLSVSVLVRSPDKLREVLGDDVARLQAVHVGSAADAASVASAVQGADAVISCAPPDPAVAHTLAQACVQAGAKVMWTAGACAARSRLEALRWHSGSRRPC